ncbi:MAG: hypothetical protein ACYDCL_06980 [Myxococcales bacterium]
MWLGILLLSLAKPLPNGERSYRILVGGREDGAAQLAIHPRPDGSLDYEWRSQIGLSRAPCLWSEQRAAGRYTPGSGRPVPDELALSLGAPGRGATATLGRDGLPDRVELAGLVYEATPGEAPRWNRCRPGGLSGGLPAPGGPQNPRSLDRAVFEAEGEAPRETRRYRGPMPRDVAAALAAAYGRAAGRDCKLVARELAEALRALGLDARVEGGFLLDRGRLWPHAWTRARVGGAFRDLDATTGSSWADAGRLDVGPLDGADEWQTGLAMLRELRSPPRLTRFAP